MNLRLITLSASDEDCARVLIEIQELGATGIRVYAETQSPGRSTIYMMADDKRRQALLDYMQGHLGLNDTWRITLFPVETTVPFPESEGETTESDEEEPPMTVGGLTREEIYDQAWRQSAVDRTYLTFVALSAVVAGFGMVADNVAVVVGAMVIAPLLGPNLALGVGVVLADRKLMLRAIVSALAGTGLAFVTGLILGLALPPTAASDELISRTEVGFDGLAIALASGSAAALSMVSGVSAALVGVMVAVALMPPMTASGIFLGAGQSMHSLDALLLFLVNVVCVNLATQAVLMIRGVTPRLWYERRKARRATQIGVAIWLVLLTALVLLLWFRTPVLR